MTTLARVLGVVSDWLFRAARWCSDTELRLCEKQGVCHGCYRPLSTEARHMMCDDCIPF